MSRSLCLADITEAMHQVCLALVVLSVLTAVVVLVAVNGSMWACSFRNCVDTLLTRCENEDEDFSEAQASQAWHMDCTSFILRVLMFGC